MFHHGYHGLRDGSVADDAYSASFNGTDEWVDFGDIQSENGSSAFTIAAWVKTSTSAVMHIVNKMDASTRGYRLYFNTNGRIFAEIRGPGGLKETRDSGSGRHDGNWHLITAVYNTSTTAIDIYDNTTKVNGIEGKPDPGDTSSSETFSIAAYENPASPGTPLFLWNGVIGDVYKFPIALNSTQITELYNGGAAINLGDTSFWGAIENNAKSLWVNWEDDTFESGSQPGVTDLSGNAYAGTAINMTDAVNKISDVPGS